MNNEPVTAADDEYYSYVLVRRDIPLPDQIVQVGHACLDAGRRFDQPAVCNLVVLEVASERNLLMQIARTEEAGLQWALFFEPDDAMGYTAACSAPVSAPDDRRHFKKLPLWR